MGDAFIDGSGRVRDIQPITGDFKDRDGNIWNLADRLLEAGSLAQPISDQIFDVSKFTPWLGVVISKKTGLPYDLDELLNGYSPGASDSDQSKQVFVFDHEPTPEEDGRIPVEAILVRTDIADEQGKAASFVKLESGEYVPLTAQGEQGERGEPGKSSYDLIVEGGYTGTFDEFMDIFKNIGLVNVSLDETLGVTFATTGERLDALRAVKTDMRAAILSRSVSVPEETPFSGYAEAVKAIPAAIGVSDDGMVEYIDQHGYTNEKVVDLSGHAYKEVSDTGSIAYVQKG